MVKLSVIIVNYKVKFFVEQCLLSVREAVDAMDEQYGERSCEVFLVDNHSEDGTVEMVSEQFPWVTLMANKENLGFSKANNQALRISKGEFHLLLNPDTLVERSTFVKTVEFMDAHPECGGLGVKMLDGKGHFLPESKRGLPTPEVAFYKIFGLSALFKKSRRFGKYHLTFLDKNHTHEVDILSGAFMLMRKDALDKVGLLDEDYFMYGEDIDLSYRLIRGGYKNYYFADTRIIHYKGESTKKSSVNYVFVFYKAMIIFAKKHFSHSHAGLFSLLIHVAVWLRAGIALIRRFALKAALPLFDFVLLYSGLYLIKVYWEQNHKYVEGGGYPSEFTYIMLPAYSLIWLMTAAVNGAYKKKPVISGLLRGAGMGTLIILIFYALLSEEYRYSRAIILLGGGWTALALIVARAIREFIRKGSFNFEKGIAKRCIIVADGSEYRRIFDLLKQTGNTSEIIGAVNISEKMPERLGMHDQLHELIPIYGATEIIFSSKDLSISGIIDQMEQLKHFDAEYKIAPPESQFIIGSSNVNTRGEMYRIDLEVINRSENKRLKRATDLSLSVLFLVLFPAALFFIKSKSHFLKHIFQVLSGKKSWVGFHPMQTTIQKLPQIKPGILFPTDAFNQREWEENTIHHLNLIYARNYSPSEDIKIVFKGFKNLGRAEQH
jgi:GT2 family glycosyltransferase